MRDALMRFQNVAVFGAGSDIAQALLAELLREGPVLCAPVRAEPR